MDHVILNQILTLLEAAEQIKVDPSSEKQLKKQLILSLHEQESQFAQLEPKEVIQQTQLFEPLDVIFSQKLNGSQNHLVVSQDYPVINLILTVVDLLFQQVDKNNQQPILLKFLIFKIRMPLLILYLSSPKSMLIKNGACLNLIVKLCDFASNWKDESDIGYPTYFKLEQLLSFKITKAEVINQQFIQILEDIKQINENQQKRSLIFEKRLKETEIGLSKTIRAKSLIDNFIIQLFKQYEVDDFVKSFVNHSWRSLLQLEYVRDDNSNFYSAVKTVLLLIKSIQRPIDNQSLNIMIDSLPVLNEALSSGIERLSVDSEIANSFTSELEVFHILLIKQFNESMDNSASTDDVTKQEPTVQEEILRLSPVNIFEDSSKNDCNTDNNTNNIPTNDKSESHITVENIENVSNLNNDFLTKVEQQIEDDNLDFHKKSIIHFNNEYLGVTKQDCITELKPFNITINRWFTFIDDENIQKLIYIDHYADQYIFVDNNAKKSNTLKSAELLSLFKSGDIKIFEHCLLTDSNLDKIKEVSNSCIITLKNKQLILKNKKDIEILEEEKISSENYMDKNSASLTEPEPVPNPEPEPEFKTVPDINSNSGSITSEDESLTNKSLNKNDVDSQYESIENEYDITRLSVGSWVKIKEHNQLIKCKLAAKITSKNSYIFVDRQGVKLFEFSLEQLVEYYKNNNLLIIDLEKNNAHLLESVITKTRDLKAEH